MWRPCGEGEGREVCYIHEFNRAARRTKLAVEECSSNEGSQQEEEIGSSQFSKKTIWAIALP